jgi:hypothetical protein
MDIQSPATSPSTRRAPMEYDAATGNVVLFGGDVSYSLPALSETWTWSQVYTTIRPLSVTPLEWSSIPLLDRSSTGDSTWVTSGGVRRHVGARALTSARSDCGVDREDPM